MNKVSTKHNYTELEHTPLSGYLHPLYAASFASIGQPLDLEFSKGRILKRPVFDSGLFDGMGVYPFLCCTYWTELERDLERLQKELISFSFVSDPLGNYDANRLEKIFSDKFQPFKTHYVIELAKYDRDLLPANHKRNIKKNRDKVTIGTVAKPLSCLDQWNRLYENLAKRHRIEGILTFSEAAFAKQLRVPGIHVFQGSVGNEIDGMLLWYRQGAAAYYHLGAFSPIGYEMNLSFKLFDYAIGYFKEMGLERLNLGGGAGVAENPGDGLARFKKGWSNSTRSTYFCGKIFDKEKYREIAEKRKLSGSRYFPAYREGDFG
ncbi:MAG: hypothetical protein KAW12_15830 [Candidatus Aminicenantes bacterium]|nr:hypothetical protein [Candidatus Aminicenantes bacterium]